MVVYWFFFKPLAFVLKNISLCRTAPGQYPTVALSKRKLEVKKRRVP